MFKKLNIFIWIFFICCFNHINSVNKTLKPYTHNFNAGLSFKKKLVDYVGKNKILLSALSLSWVAFYLIQDSLRKEEAKRDFEKFESEKKAREAIFKLKEEQNQNNFTISQLKEEQNQNNFTISQLKEELIIAKAEQQKLILQKSESDKKEKLEKEIKKKQEDDLIVNSVEDRLAKEEEDRKKEEKRLELESIARRQLEEEERLKREQEENRFQEINKEKIELLKKELDKIEEELDEQNKRIKEVSKQNDKIKDYVGVYSVRENEFTKEAIKNKYSINLMWINRDFVQDQKYIYPAETEAELNEKFLKYVECWAQLHEKVNILYDGKLVSEDAVKNTKDAIAKLNNGSHVFLKNLRGLDIVKKYEDVFDDTGINPSEIVEKNLKDYYKGNKFDSVKYKKLPLYFRIDLYRAMAAYQSAKEGEIFVYADLDMKPISFENLFDDKTIENLNKFGIVMADGGHHGFENGFQIVVPGDKELLFAMKEALINLNVLRARLGIKQGYFITGCRFSNSGPFFNLQQILYDSYPQMFLLFYKLKKLINQTIKLNLIDLNLNLNIKENQYLDDNFKFFKFYSISGVFIEKAKGFINTEYMNDFNLKMDHIKSLSNRKFIPKKEMEEIEKNTLIIPKEWIKKGMDKFFGKKTEEEEEIEIETEGEIQEGYKYFIKKGEDIFIDVKEFLNIFIPTKKVDLPPAGLNYS